MLQLQIDNCRREEVDALSHLLDETEALSVTFSDQHDVPILEPELGTTPLWPTLVVQALYAEESEALHVQSMLHVQFPHLHCVVSEVPEQDWERVCMADFKPQQFGKRLWVCPSWLTPPDATAVNLILDPGLAFGTGTHPTTSLCLQWLEKTSVAQKTLIDYGCGSGILALAALKLGAHHIDAVDLDEQALLATQNNAATNHLSLSALTIGFPDTLKTPVDIVMANILLTPLLELRSRFFDLLKPQGILVMSGVLKEQAALLIEHYQPAFMHHETMIEDDWALLVFIKSK